MPKKKPLVYDNERYAICRGFGVNEFGKLLEDVLIRESKDNKKDSFSPSGFGYSGRCPRYFYYRFNGAYFDYSKNTPESISNMNAGSDAGVRLAKMLEDAGMLIDSEVDVEYEDPPIHGFIDAIINWKGDEVVVEIKTTKDSAWNYRVANNQVPWYQMLQLLLYMYITDHDKGMFLTENKDSNKIFILPIRMTDKNKEFVEQSLEWMRMVKDNADNGKLPTRSFDKSSFECKGCEFFSTCYAGYQKATKLREEVDPSPGEVTLPTLRKYE